jgi:Lrp/AsnC family leucine-responsive transcriptional regulator
VGKNHKNLSNIESKQMENSKFIPDKTDRTILRELQKDGRISNVELARRVNLSESACLRRVRVLEEQKVIDGYVGLVNAAKAGLPGNVFVRITLQRQQQKDLEEFEAAVRRVPEVMECYLMTGDSDYLLRVVVANAPDFERLHYQQLTRLPGVARVQSGFALRTVIKRTAIPID